MIKTTVKTSKSTLKTISKRETTQLLNKIGVEVTTHIRTRTENGKDINNRSFEAYSDSTIEQKKRKGQSTSVNLKDSSKMLNSIRWKNITNGIEVYLIDRNKIASYHQNGSGKLPQRKWFGLTDIIKSRVVRKVFNSLKIKFK
jgi:hypothetical protein